MTDTEMADILSNALHNIKKRIPVLLELAEEQIQSVLDVLDLDD
jgi:hypothetical protein